VAAAVTAAATNLPKPTAPLCSQIDAEVEELADANGIVLETARQEVIDYYGAQGQPVWDCIDLEDLVAPLALLDRHVASSRSPRR
jgi:hypothetical protein